MHPSNAQAPIAVTPLEIVTELAAGEVELYNLKLIGEGVHIISEDEDVACYYPEKFKYARNPRESVELISDGKVYAERWVEEGFDEENGCETEDYKIYGKVVVRDFNGKILSEEVGSINRAADGVWWIS